MERGMEVPFSRIVNKRVGQAEIAFLTRRVRDDAYRTPSTQPGLWKGFPKGNCSYFSGFAIHRVIHAINTELC